jgi:hypothetical protein
MGRALRLAVMGAPVGGGGVSYQSRVLALSPIRYWPLDDAAGSAIARELVAADNGTPANVTFGVAGIGDGKTAASFDGSSSNINIYSAALNAAFNGNNGSLLVWASVDVWAEGAGRRAAWLSNAAGTSSVAHTKWTDNRLRGSYTAGGTETKVIHSALTTTALVHMAITWNRTTNEFKYFVSGAQSGTTQTTSGTFEGPLANNVCNIGSYNGGAQFWRGDIAHVALFNVDLTPTQIADLATL